MLGFWFLGWCFVCVVGLPSGRENKYAKQIPSDDALKFMKRFGYLVDDNGQSEAIYSEENLGNVIKNLQKFGGINQTGIIDNTTLKLMTSPRCGVPDIISSHSKRKKRFNIINGWNKRHITYYISNWSSKLGEESVARNIQKALDIWGNYARLTFTRSSRPDADIIVAFGRGYHGDRYPFDGPGLILAHAFFPDDSQAAGDIHFDEDEEWIDLSGTSDPDTIGTDFFTVALHELGHSLGLAHSTVPTSVMFPYYKGTEGGALDYDDIMGMYNLYIQRRLDSDDNPESTTTTTTIRPTRRITTTTTTTRPTRRTTTTTRRRNPWLGPRPESTTQRHHVMFEGDVESVDDHKRHDPHNTNPENSSPSLPYICQGHFDAVATLRDELFIFKDEYMWRLKDKGMIVQGYPAPFRQMFRDLPSSVKKIDAAFQRPDGNIALFTGHMIWITDGSRMLDGSPLPLSYYGLPDYLDGIDAVQTWAKNNKTYFYKKDRFWRYDEKRKMMDDGYPMRMDRWRGVPEDLDAATTWKDGITYFFKGDLFWKFDNDWVKPTDTSPLPIAPIWLGCEEDVGKMKQLFGA